MIVTFDVEIVYVVCPRCCRRIEHPIGGGGRMALYYLYLKHHANECSQHLVSYAEYRKLKLRKAKVLKARRRYNLSEIISKKKFAALARRVEKKKGLERDQARKLVGSRLQAAIRKSRVLYGCRCCGRPITARMAKNGGLGVRCRQKPKEASE